MEQSSVLQVVLKSVTKVFNSPGRSPVHALAGVSLGIEDNECVVILGPSGSGKTTLLRLIAGLESITSGELLLEGQLLTSILPQNRPVAMVFQEPALFPHLSIAENLTFGLRLRGGSKDEMARRLGPISEMLGLTELLRSRPAEISGGQRQRVALGRALLRQARIVLLDEPFANLDPRWRTQLRQDLSVIRENLGTTVLYATHDHVEAMLTGDRIAVLRDGSLQQLDPPDTVYRSPANLFVAEFVGFPQMNCFHGQLMQGEGQVWFEVKSSNQRAPLTAATAAAHASGADRQFCLPVKNSWAGIAERYTGRAAILALRPEHITWIQSPRGDIPPAGVRATIDWVKATGPDVYLGARVGGTGFVVRAPANRATPTEKEGYFEFRTDLASLFDSAAGNRLLQE